VLQGERPMAAENKSIGRFILDGILPAPRGMPQIEVTFDIDANGILSVSAKDRGTGREQKMVVQPSSGLSKEEIERMVQEAQAHAEEDRRRREEVETRNQADSLAYGAEKMLRDNADKIPADLKAEVEGKIAAVRSALQGGQDVSYIRRTMDDLNASMQKIGQAVYSAQQSAGGGQPGGGQGGGGQQGQGPEGTVEGEFREV